MFIRHNKCDILLTANRGRFRLSMTAGIIRAGRARSVCEVNRISGQQQKPTESNPQLAVGASRNLLALAGGGRQKCSLTNQNPFHYINNTTCVHSDHLMLKIMKNKC